jgi:hypothetical protein
MKVVTPFEAIVLDTAAATPTNGTLTVTVTTTPAVKVDLTGEPSNLPKVLFLGEIPLLSKGEIATIVALPSSGKSNVCEGIVASYTRAKGFEPLDALNFVCPSEHAKKILWIDTERTTNDLLWSVQRLKRRCKMDAAQLAEHLDFFSFVEIANPAEALTELTMLVSSGNYDAVILDGIFDLCPDINNIEKATLLVKELRALAVKHDVVLVTTIHPNKGTDVIAGHLGAMLYRFSRAILYIEKQANGVRRLTSEIGQGKLSYSSEPANSFFKWCDADGMFISCEPQSTTPTSYDSAIVKAIFADATQMPSKEFKAKYSEKTGYKAATTNAHCLAMQTDEIIKRDGNGGGTIYRLLSDETIPF